MFFKFYTFILVLILFTSTLMVSSSSSWMLAWFGLEINLMSFIPLLILNPSPSSSEASIKYFLTQALASLFLIFSSIMLFKFLSVNSMNSQNSLITISLGVKMGMAPTHFWFPQVMELINWTQAIILLTWQKIAPMILLFSCLDFLILFVLIIFSSTLGSISGFNINSLKKIMTFSSVTHLAWMASASLINFKTWIIYFSIYSLISCSIIMIFLFNNLNSINNLNNLTSSKLSKSFLLLNLMSLGGLPPLLGIFPKIMILSLMTHTLVQEMIISIFLIVSSAITLFFYTKIVYSCILLNSSSQSFNTIKNFNYSPVSSFILTTSLVGNVIIMPLVLLI